MDYHFEFSRIVIWASRDASSQFIPWYVKQPRCVLLKIGMNRSILNRGGYHSWRSSSETCGTRQCVRISPQPAKNKNMPDSNLLCSRIALLLRTYIWAFWGQTRWGHFFKKSLWLHRWHNSKRICAKWKIWILSFIFQMIPMSLCRLIDFDTIALQSWVFFPKKSKMLKYAPFSHALKTCFWHSFV